MTKRVLTFAPRKCNKQNQFHKTIERGKGIIKKLTVSLAPTIFRKRRA